MSPCDELLLYIFVFSTSLQMNESALHMAAKLQRFSVQVAEMLVKSGAKLDERNKVRASSICIILYKIKESQNLQCPTKSINESEEKRNEITV